MAQRAQDRAFLLEAHNGLGNVLFFIGEFALAREHMEQGFALYDSQQHHFMTLLRELDPGVTCLSRAATALFILGYPDQSLQRIRAALRLAQELSHPLSLAYALDLAAGVHLSRREAQAAQEHAEAMIALSREHGFSFRLAVGTISRGGALTAQGRAEEGIAQIRQGLAALLETGVEVARPYYLALLAEAYGRLGQVEEGLALLAEALAVVHKIGQHGTEGLLYWLKGTLALQSQTSPQQVKGKSKASRGKSAVTSPQSLTSNPQAEAEAEAYFLKAIEIAQRQQAKSLELRAVTSLSRLWQQQGKKDEARQMLAEVYGWFTEGFDTADLQEAKALLAELTR